MISGEWAGGMLCSLFWFFECIFTLLSYNINLTMTSLVWVFTAFFKIKKCLSLCFLFFFNKNPVRLSRIHLSTFHKLKVLHLSHQMVNNLFFNLSPSPSPHPDVSHRKSIYTPLTQLEHSRFTVIVEMTVNLFHLAEHLSHLIICWNKT